MAGTTLLFLLLTAFATSAIAQSFRTGLNSTIADISFEGGDQDGLPRALSTGHWTSDNKSDLLACSPANNTCWLFFGRTAQGPGSPPVLPDITFVGVGSGWGTGAGFVGDLNGDGFEDIAVGVPLDTGLNATPLAGSVYIFFSRDDGWTGLLNYDQADARIYADTAFEGFGTVIARAGDIDHDGYDDFWVGAPSHYQGNVTVGAVYLLRGGLNLAPIAGIGTAALRILGTEAYSQFGASVLGAVDLDGDGESDLVVGAPKARDAGNATVGRLFGYLGPLPYNGSSLAAERATFTVTGNRLGQDLGASLAVARNLTGSGPTLLAGAPGDPYGGGGAVLAFRLSNLMACCQNVSASSAFALLYSPPQVVAAGTATAVAPDIDGDGTEDLLVGAPFAQPGGLLEAGSIYLFFGGSSIQGTLNMSVANASIEAPASYRRFGAAIAVGDFNGDGLSDFFVGAPAENSSGWNAGAVHGFMGRPRNRAPTGNLTASGPFLEGHNYSVTITVLDPDGDSLQWSWDLGTGGGWGSFPNASTIWVNYFDNGNYTVQVLIADGLSSTILSIAFQVANVDPSCTIASSGPAIEGLPVEFLANASDPGPLDVLTFAWVAPAGLQGNGSSFQYTPIRGGNLEVRFEVQDNDGGRGLCNLTIPVQNLEPSLTLLGPSEIFEGQAADFTAVVADPGVPPFESLEWRVDGLLSGNGTSFHFQAGQPAVHYVNATVVDIDGAEGIATWVLRVIDRIPDVELFLPLGIQEGRPSAVEVRQLSGFLYDPLTVAWDVCAAGRAEGLFFQVDRSPSPGFCVRVIVYDDDRSAVALTGTVAVSNLGPVALIHVDPLGLLDEGTEVNLSALVGAWETSPSVAFEWWINGSPLGDGPSIWFVPPVGTWRVILNATDSDGGLSEFEVILRVQNIAPVVSLEGPRELQTGEVGSWRASAADASGQPPTLQWSIDGAAEPETSIELSRSWAQPGSHVIRVVATDEYGATNESTWSVKVTASLATSTSVVDAGVLLIGAILAAGAVATVWYARHRRSEEE